MGRGYMIYSAVLHALLTHIVPLPLLAQHWFHEGREVDGCTSKDGPGNNHEDTMALCHHPDNTRAEVFLRCCNLIGAVVDRIDQFQADVRCFIMMGEPSVVSWRGRNYKYKSL